MKYPIVYIPESREEAALLLKRLSSLRSGGKDIAVSFSEGFYRRRDIPGSTREGPAATTVKRGRGAAADILSIVSENTPTEGGVIAISHEGFSQIREVSKPDLLAAAGGGVSLGSLREAAAEDGLFLPFDQDLFDEEMTLAELIMSGAFSRYEGRYGTLRESILSLSMVTAAGEFIHTGSHSVKDVAGYEIAGFVIGSGGRCGLIDSVSLRLLPEPAKVSYLVFSGAYGELDALAGKLLKTAPVSIAVYHGAAAKLFSGGKIINGSSLLVAEMHHAVAGDDGEMIQLATGPVRESSVDRVEDFDGMLAKRRFPASIAGYYGAGTVLESLTVDLKKFRPPDTCEGRLSWNRYYPHRGIHIWEAGGRDHHHALPEQVEDAVKGNLASGARVRFELLSVVEDRHSGGLKIAKKRLPLSLLAAGDPDLFRAVSPGEAITGISEKIYALFDPEGIIVA
ncbi:MAG: FAD-binding oxidoreductase [Candidatus Krumholzibacteriota bacterium]|nr:FAD-binding oxidoreductase [Candidatus Krumholzibacteriota bacterium]